MVYLAPVLPLAWALLNQGIVMYHCHQNLNEESIAEQVYFHCATHIREFK